MHRKLIDRRRHAWQQGVVLPVTLIVLVAMTLAGIALLRSVDTSSVIAGNMAFRQSATASGDAGVETAIAWLRANQRIADDAGNGYYATSQDGLDLTGNKQPATTADDLDWSDSGKVKKIATDAAGNDVAYVIHRMCTNIGPLDPTTCSTEQGDVKGRSYGSTRQMDSYQPGSPDAVVNRGYYRITVRVTGPRNTTSYVQAVISI